MDQKKLNEILEKHVLWLHNERGGVRANLSGANLYGADLSRANLYKADLSGANLYGADLSRANLSGVNLYKADLSGANLRKADLSGANLSGVNLYKADLSGANLYGADLSRVNLRRADLSRVNLSGVNLRRANLSGANLYGADLSRVNLSGVNLRRANLSGVNLRKADLSGANLYGADLSRADLSEAKNVPYIPMVCPDSGSFIAWKKAFSSFGEAYLVKLLIPEDARRSSATGRKCRADKAEVLAIEPIEPVPVIVDKVHSRHDPNFYYQVGQYITIPNFDTDRFNECAPGIHFFINRQEAIDYCFT